MWSFILAASFSLLASAHVQVPSIVVANPEHFTPLAVAPILKAATCQDALRGKEHTAWSHTVQIINAASKNFVRRGWSREFIDERIKLASLFRDRAEYYALERGTDIVGTLGYSWTEYGADVPLDREQAVSEKDVPWILPGELSLHSKPFPRPLDSNHRGIIAELRSWAIDKEFLVPAERANADAQLLAWLIPSVLARVQPYPELFGKPILYTYADEVSLKLYGMMGFEKISSEPIQHSGSNWWILAITPKNLERFIARMRKPEFLMNLNQNFEVTIPQGKFLISGQASSGYSGAFMSDRTGVNEGAGVAHLAAEATVGPGIVAAEGSNYVHWDKNGNVHSVSALAQPYEVEKGIVADIYSSLLISELKDGEFIHLYDNGHLMTDVNSELNLYPSLRTPVPFNAISILQNDVEILAGVWAAQGSGLAWTADRSTVLVQKLKKTVVLTVEGLAISAAAGATLETATTHIYISNLLSPVRLPDGRVVTTGQGLMLKKLREGHIDWNHSSIL